MTNKTFITILIIIFLFCCLTYGNRESIKNVSDDLKHKPFNKEFYNDQDKTDFGHVNGGTIVFKFLQFKNAFDKKTLNEWSLSGNHFLFIGGINGNGTTKTTLDYKYYGWVKTNRGAIYFAEIPGNKVRIYQDAKPGEVYLTACDEYTKGYKISIEVENKWRRYDYYNLHVPKGTIIPKLDTNNMDLNNTNL